MESCSIHSVLRNWVYFYAFCINSSACVMLLLNQHTAKKQQLSRVNLLDLLALIKLESDLFGVLLGPTIKLTGIAYL